MNIRYKINVLAATALLIASLYMSSCKEVGPQINLTNGKHNVLLDTSYIESPVQAPEPKNVLIEMFTGVSCINCPAAHVVLDDLIAHNNGRVIGIALHSTAEPASQDDQLTDSKVYLGTADAQSLISLFGEPGGRPAGAVDRVAHNGAFGHSVGELDFASNWGGYTSTQLALATPVNMMLTRTYLDSSRALTVNVQLHYTAAQADSDKITVVLTEDSIVTSQLQSDNSDDSTYVHNAILRGAVTDILGNRINAQLVAGTVVNRILTYTINPAWKPEHMHIVAFVHKYQNSKEVLQTKIISVK